MRTVELLRELVLDDWTFWVESGSVRYRAPKASLDDSRLAVLAARKSEILEILTGRPEAIDVFGLSHGQRALWFLWALAPESTAYNQALKLRVGPDADARRWRHACRLLSSRHESLRTVFPRHDNVPIQRVLPVADPDWAIVDVVTGGSEQAAMLAVQREPFDLEAGPLVRFRLVRSGRESTLLIVAHHIVVDGWSFEIMSRECPWLYDLAGSEPGTAPSALDHSYREYVRWQRQLVNGPDGERSWQYWSRELAELPPPLDLPTDRPRPARQTSAGASLSVDLPPDVSDGIRALAATEGATPFVALMATFLVLLYRYSGQPDIVLGTPTAGRSQAEFAGIVGYFVEPVVVRARFGAGQTFRELLGVLRDAVARSMEHAGYPFALLVEKLRIERDPSRSPLFDVLFNFFSRSAVTTNGQDSPTWEALPADGKFDLTLTVVDKPLAMEAVFSYNTDLFDRDTVARMGEDFTTIVEGVVVDPDQIPDDIPLPGTGTAVPVKRGRPPSPAATVPFHRLLEEQVGRHPDVSAVVAGETTLSYGSLNQRANALARRLVAAGVCPGSVVGICSERTADFIVALLATMKAGAAYLPLDPANPAALLRGMVQDAAAVAVVTQSAFADRFDVVARLIDLDGPIEADAANLEVDVRPEDLAYVIFTSGSTGRPKGVAVEHRSLSNYVASMTDDLGIEPGSAFALVSTVGADLGHTALFLALVTGGCVHVLPESVATDGRAFASYVGDKAIDYLKIVPSHLAALFDDGGPATLPRKGVILGGEGATTGWVAGLRALAPDCRFFNHYGPTEATVGVLTMEIDTAEPGSSQPVALRTPVAGSDIYLLDPRGRSVSHGVGEIFIGGAPVARGYVNDPALTRARFISLDGGRARVYRTGDRARQVANGDIELLGRTDRQVNLRGFRIELAQIESALGASRFVRHCVVLPDRDGAGAAHLVAYVACRGDVDEASGRGSSLVDHLTEHLAGLVPRHMLPSRIVVVDGMPLTPNGKVDTAALRASGSVNPTPSRAILARDPVEMHLTRLWSAALGVSRIGVRDDFFALGGHSLLAVRLAGMIEEELAVRVPLAAFFTSRTIEDMAALVRSAPATTVSSVVVPLLQGGSGAPLFCLPGAGGSVMYFAELVLGLGDDRPTWGLQSEPEDGLPASIEEMASPYLDLVRDRGPDRGPYLFAGHSFGALVGYELARRLWVEEGAVSFLAVLDNAAPGSAPDQMTSTWSDTQWLLHIGTRMNKLYETDLGLSRARFLAADPAEQVDLLVESMLAAGLLPRGTNAAYFRRFIALYKASAMAAAAYRPEPSRLPIRMALFRAASNDPQLERGEVSGGADMGWSQYSSHPVDIVEVEGTHITMMTVPRVGDLAKQLRLRLATFEPG